MQGLKYPCMHYLDLELLLISHFPTFMGNDGIVRQEVPILMVALVATAVSAAMSM